MQNVIILFSKKYACRGPRADLVVGADRLRLPAAIVARGVGLVQLEPEVLVPAREQERHAEGPQTTWKEEDGCEQSFFVFVFWIINLRKKLRLRPGEGGESGAQGGSEKFTLNTIHFVLSLKQ
jgi:hypothetical protein